MRSCLLCLFVKAAVHRLFLRDTYFQIKTSDTSVMSAADGSKADLTGFWWIITTRI